MTMQQSNSLIKSAADIHENKVKMDKYWNSYVQILLKKITLSERTYHHQIVSCHSNKLVISVFNYLQLEVIRLSAFGPVNIEYRTLIQDTHPVIAQTSFIDSCGLLDGSIPHNDQEQVFQHYLNKLQPLYDYLNELSYKGK